MLKRCLATAAVLLAAAMMAGCRAGLGNLFDIF